MSSASSRCVSLFLAAAVFLLFQPSSADAKGYSSGGRSYSSHSSSSSSHSSSSGSHSFSSGGSRGSSGTSTHSSGSGSSSHTFSSAPSHTSGSSSGSKSFSSGGGKSYSSGSTWSDEGRHSYSSGKSYSSGSSRTTTSSSSSGSSTPPTSSHKADTSAPKSYNPGSSRTYSSGSDPSPPATGPSAVPRKAVPDATTPGMSFDTAAARARKEQSSKSDFSQYKESQKPPVIPPGSGSGSTRVQPPPVPSSGGYTRTPTYIPDRVTLSTRPVRIYNYYSGYYSRPVVYYHDPYNSFFWWWLLDRSLDDRAYWAYHHRYDMDPSRYDALLAHDQQLESRIQQLESQQVARDPNYVPPDLQENRDLMYTDRYVNHTYSNRPTAAGRVAFWVIAVPVAAGMTAFFIWLIWFKRWQPAT